MFEVKKIISKQIEKKYLFCIEKCLDIPFIPCMNKTPKLVKYTDHPFYPQNTDIANLFADILPIIKLPGNFEIML
jgi:hypothetical protein